MSYFISELAKSKGEKVVPLGVKVAWSMWAQSESDQE